MWIECSSEATLDIAVSAIKNKGSIYIRFFNTCGEASSPGRFNLFQYCC